MTKDEMKNRISMALKDPILQQGFECICKENAELDCQKNRNKFCYSCANATERCFKNEISCPCQKYKSYTEENAELKEVHESDKRSLALIAKKGADFENAYNEAEELLDKQIEATYKLFEENKELKADNKALREKVHWWKKEVNVAHRARADEFEKLVIENKVLKRKLTYAKTIIQDLLDNTDEYARQRAEDFLKENK